jgi:hypothetical protein
MTAIEIKAKERELIQEINNDANLLELVLQYVRKLKKTQQKAPCQYTIDELKARLKEGRISAKEGTCKTQSEMRQKHTL